MAAAEVNAQHAAVCAFLQDLEEQFKYLRLLHGQEVILQDQYIPVQVSLEDKPRKVVEDFFSGYIESSEELKRAYALKGMGEEPQKTQVDWVEAKKKHKRLMVLADPGMGKTTLLKQESLTHIREQRQQLEQQKLSVDDVVLPIFLRLSELDEQPEELMEAIPALLARNYAQTATPLIELLHTKFTNGQCLLLLDALDEVLTANRTRLAKRVERFARNSACPIICTSRIVGYGGFVRALKEVEIVPFRQKQIEQYIETWFVHSAQDFQESEDTGHQPSAKGLIQELRQKPQLRGLAQNPLLLSLLCSLYQQAELTLPARRGQVYAKAVMYMLSGWRRDNQRTQVEDAWVFAKIELLEKLAYAFSSEDKEVFTLRELMRKIDEFKGDSAFSDAKTPDIIRELCEQDGFIQKLDRIGDTYLFLHRTFQEYFTASYLQHAENSIALAKEHIWDFDWHEILSLFAGLLDDPVPFLRALLAEKDDIFYTLLLLTG